MTSKKPNRITLRKTLDKHWDVVGFLPDLKKQIEDAIAQYGDKYKLWVEQTGYEDASYELIGERYENDVEYKNRCEKEEAAEQAKTAKDRELFDKLKKKYGWT